MEPREPDEGLPVGIRPAPGKLRRQPEAKRIADRVARFPYIASVAEHVVPLNPGFFQLEAMRAASAAKKRGKVRAKVRGK